MDRLRFERQQLPNGITVHQQRVDSPFTLVNMHIPVGSVHNTRPYPYGIAHFLEHVCFQRSLRFPTKRAFDEMIGQKGGTTNAITSPFFTDYWISIPNDFSEVALEGLFSLTFEPLLIEQDIQTERGIVGNERSAHRWYPGTNEVEEYLMTKWQSNKTFSLEQLFGTDDDLARLSSNILQDFHKQYFDPRIQVVAVGSASLDPLLVRLSALPLATHTLREHYKVHHWIDRTWREMPFRDVSRYELHMAGIITPPPDIRTCRRIRFILDYLTNQVHGALYEWLREEKGWVYGIDTFTQRSHNAYQWTMMFPLSEHAQVNVVRGELRGRMETALKDTKAIEREVDRLKRTSCFWYETSESVLEGALNSLADWGRIYTVSELLELIDSCKDPQALFKLYKTYFSEDAIGMICTIPERSAAPMPRSDLPNGSPTIPHSGIEPQEERVS